MTALDALLSARGIPNFSAYLKALGPGQISQDIRSHQGLSSMKLAWEGWLGLYQALEELIDQQRQVINLALLTWTGAAADSMAYLSQHSITVLEETKNIAKVTAEALSDWADKYAVALQAVVPPEKALTNQNAQAHNSQVMASYQDNVQALLTPLRLSPLAGPCVKNARNTR